MRLTIIFRWLCALYLALLFSSVNAGAELQMDEVVFEEREPGLEPFRSRFLANESFLRLDDGTDMGDFVLYDRKTGQIHSFNREESTHLLIKPQQATKIDFDIDFRVEKRSLQDAPKIKGITAVEHQFFADATKCKHSVNVKGLLEDMARAMMEYEQALVEHAKKTLSRVPASMKKACYMANNYLHASDYLKVGFPLHVVDDEGRQKRLLSFQQVVKPASIVQFPEGYRVFYPDGSM